MNVISAIVFGILASAPVGPISKPDYEAAARSMRAQLGEAFHVQESAPFVVAGNLPEPEFKRITTGTIRSCSQALYKDFLKKKPKRVIKVYLFASDQDYRTYAKKLFGDTPTTKFGYYKSTEEALVMNIATGTGTLVHEMTHALMKPDFPEVPAWFNEGLASLFEQCYVRDGSLLGLVNWRLPRLKQAITEGKVIPLTQVVASTTAEFYGDKTGLYYAEARYLCFYLQEKKVLRKFYKEFRDHAEKDRTGRLFLEKLLGKPLPEVEKNWLEWVKTLHWPVPARLPTE